MDKPQASTYRLYAASGRYIRTATQVTFPDGEVVRFLERLPKRRAIEQARPCPARLELCGVPCGCGGRNPSHG